MTEPCNTTQEHPDAIGWQVYGKSVLVECKVSLADLRADASKEFRWDPQLGMGRERYIMAPRGLLNLQQLPQGWGLVEVLGGRRARTAHKSGVFVLGRRAMLFEAALLVRATRSARGDFIEPSVSWRETWANATLP